MRRRVTLVTLAILAIALAGVVAVVDTAFGATSTRSLDAVLADRIQLTQQLAAQRVRPGTLIQRVDGHEVRAELVLASGRAFGAHYDSRSLAAAVASGAKVRRLRLSTPGQLDGASVTLVADAPLLTGARTTLLWVLILTAVGAIALTALGLVIAVRFALAPLDAMTTLARSIQHGGRGRRLAPDRTDTELGRTAHAFDDMLDALEGAEQASKASEEHLRRFVADAAHELRTPVAGVQAVAETVLQQPPDADPEERQRLHLLLIREARRASELVHDLLDLARIDAGVQLDRRGIDLRGLADTQADRARVQYPDVNIDVEGAAPEVFADPDRVSQILANVVDNACQAVATTTSEGAAVSIQLSSTGDFAEVVISDTGPGVPPMDSERIFDRLVRLDASRDHRSGGSGLGLPVARGLARAHGGDLGCDQRPQGTGAVFRLTLPLAGHAEHDTQPLPRP